MPVLRSEASPATAKVQNKEFRSQFGADSQERSLGVGDLWTSKPRLSVTLWRLLLDAKPWGWRPLNVKAKVFSHSTVPIVRSEASRQTTFESWSKDFWSQFGAGCRRGTPRGRRTLNVVASKCVASRICFVYSLVAAMILICSQRKIFDLSPVPVAVASRICSIYTAALWI